MHTSLPDILKSKLPSLKIRLLFTSGAFLCILLFYPSIDLINTLFGSILLALLYITLIIFVEWLHRTYTERADTLLNTWFLSWYKRLSHFTIILVLASLLSVTFYAGAWWLVDRKPFLYDPLDSFLLTVILVLMFFYYDLQLIKLQELLPTPIAVTDKNDKIVRLSSAELLFVLPVLPEKRKVQIFDKNGQAYIGFFENIQEITKNDRLHTLYNLGDDVWIDKTLWSDDENHPGIYRTLYTLGGLVNLPIEEVLMIVQKRSVYTLFTENGLFFMPAVKEMRTLFAVDIFEYGDKFAWRKGMDPETIQNRIFQKGMEVAMKR